MSVPGAEHPDKVANIVKGQGALEGMRGLYGDYIPHLGVGWSEGMRGDKEGWAWKGKGEEKMKVSYVSDIHTGVIADKVSNRIQMIISFRYSWVSQLASEQEYELTTNLIHLPHRSQNLTLRESASYGRRSYQAKSHLRLYPMLHGEKSY
jgi:hypothetical protein